MGQSRAAENCFIRLDRLCPVDMVLLQVQVAPKAGLLPLSHTKSNKPILIMDVLGCIITKQTKLCKVRELVEPTGQEYCLGQKTSKDKFVFDQGRRHGKGCSDLEGAEQSSTNNSGACTVWHKKGRLQRNLDTLYREGRETQSSPQESTKSAVWP